ncbi:hypothetical protein CEXT_54271 [Caerostris extrusa]|uniref:Uncharacterized protein n=1 Tax=Caerostris extrusa TaxID=172846 RepID=A0AAV4QJM8_CAEEX|nr:hypothetical protein CEXT_54271 [Caerostris extrusa]
MWEKEEEKKEEEKLLPHLDRVETVSFHGRRAATCFPSLWTDGFLGLGGIRLSIRWLLNEEGRTVENTFISRQSGRHLLPQSLDEWFLGVGEDTWDAFRWLLNEEGRT